jgi:hypothetical protein
MSNEDGHEAGYVRALWLAMLTPPWHPLKGYSPFGHVSSWLFGWLASILGLILGAFIATPIVTRLNLANTPFQDWVIYGIVVLSAFVVQLLSPFIWIIVMIIRNFSGRHVK